MHTVYAGELLVERVQRAKNVLQTTSKELESLMTDTAGGIILTLT